jgi:hypothetical protein
VENLAHLSAIDAPSVASNWKLASQFREEQLAKVWDEHTVSGPTGRDERRSEAESCGISHHVHRIEFRQILRDAEIAYAISPVVSRHALTEEEPRNSCSN